MNFFLPKTLKFCALTFVSAMILLSSCGSDDDDNTPAPQPQPTPPPSVTPSDAYGVLAAVNVKIPSPVILPGAPTEINMGTAVATFYNSPGSQTFQEAGAISVNQKTLTKNANNSYSFTPAQTDPTGIDFSGGVNWSVGGAGSVPAFTKTVAGGMPRYATITSGTTITKSSGYTFTIEPVTTGDSIVFMIASSDNTYAMKTVHRSATTATFSATELSGLSNSDQAVIQANVYSITSETVSGKKFYFVNQANTSLTGAKIQ